MSAGAIEAARRYIEIGRPQQALEWLAALDSDQATRSEARRLRGYALLAMKDFDGAAEAARNGLEDDPGSIEPLYLLSHAEERRGRLGAAEAAILAALEQDSDDVQLLTQYADVLMHGRALDKAARVIDAAAASDPDSLDVLESRIALAYLRGNDRESRRLSEELLARDPESVRGHQELDAIGSENAGLLVLAATNAPWDVDDALKRPGRFDRVVFVSPPDVAARKAILQLALDGRPTAGLDLDDLAERTALFSGADLRALVEHAVDKVIDEALDSGADVPIRRAHLAAALRDARATTGDWPRTARNYVEFANHGGRYDDVLAFLDSREGKAARKR